jgi:uncharacterized protein YgiM (DUF1202 family)
MKAIKLLLSITFVALLFTACNTHVVKTENLNVRSAPTKNGKVIGQLHYNDRVKVTPHNEAWGQMFIRRSGWICSHEAYGYKKGKFQI